MNCSRLEKTLVDSVAWMAALQVYWRKSQEIQSSSQSPQTVLITMNTCSTKMQQFLLTICHAPMSQYIVPFAPHHSQGTHRPSGNIMLCTNLSVSIPIMVSFQKFLESYWCRCLFTEQKKGL